MTISVIIPAYNEEKVIARLLDALDDPAHRDALDVIVVCNGCTDNTAKVAESHSLAPRVVSLADGSKHQALVMGDELARDFPRLYVDADVVISARDLARLAAILEEGDVLAVAPERDLRLEGSAWAVRAYYKVWERLPAVGDGLFGRGVLGVSQAGFSRISPRPEVLGDDLYLHSRFSTRERKVVADATSVVFGPRTVRDLVRRRIRAARGNSDLNQQQVHAPSTQSSLREVARSAARQPARLPDVAVFLVVTLISRTVARSRGQAAGWLRDESSRTSAS